MPSQLRRGLRAAHFAACAAAARIVAVGLLLGAGALAGSAQSDPIGALLNREPQAEASASLDDMIGQMLMVGFAGRTPATESAKGVVKALAAGTVGGVVVLGGNVGAKRDVMALTAAFNSAVPASGLQPFVGVDQEGGTVQRLGPKQGYRKYPSAERIAASGDVSKAAEIYTQMAAEIAANGFNLNFGPVVDLNSNPNNPVIAKLGRSYGADAASVTAFAKSFVDAHADAGVLTAAKHFPGHGSSTVDSHKGFVDITHSWSEAELLPYKQLQRAGKLDMVMIGHLYHPRFSPDGRHPATLSSKAIIGLLRRDVGFDGVAITDDLGMSAVRSNYDLSETLVRAVNAGNDILMITHAAFKGANDPRAIVAIIKGAVRDGKISETRIIESYRRIVALKRKLAVSAQR